MTARRTERPLPGVTGIVLAGGRSSRFGSDKLRAEISGKSLLEHAVESVAEGATEVIVVCAPDDDRPLPEARIPVRRVVDPAAFGGPLVGLRSGLEAAAEPIVIVVGGDMPSVRPSVLAALIRALLAAPDQVNAAVLASRGTLVPLPAALRTGAATDRVRRLVDDGERRLRSVFEQFPTRILDETEWRPLDPDGATLLDVDRPSDLAQE
ncbi:MAG: molybdenum cofactor guanylyltransferase [Chloroflexi bacterium]|nr:MAG: molybdenum cofactor guanylyltransferase [Chloroflexota bacterium]